jgi:hypothetical protein
VASSKAVACNRSSGHLDTLIGTATASLSATLAVIMLVFSAFGCACLADVRAQCANLLGDLASPGHHRCGKSADVGAVHVELDAAGHLLDVTFLQAGTGTVVTCRRTVVTGFNA